MFMFFMLQIYISSEDEVDVLLHGTPDQKRKLIRECLTGESESSSEDEFEKEMEAELNSTIKTMEDKLSSLDTGKLSSVWARTIFVLFGSPAPSVGTQQILSE